MRFLLLYFSLQVFTTAAFGAIPATAIWEIRSTATAANANGCFFVPGGTGSDLSTNDNASYGFGDLASAAGTTNPCVITSASHNFVTNDENNGIHITAGTNWTQGWYHIVSTSGNAATLDRACGTAVSLSSGTFKVGGACSLGSSTANQTDANMFNASTAGNKFYIKLGSYTMGGAVTLTTTGGTQKPTSVEGYAVTRGDKPVGSTRPTLTMGANLFTAVDNWDFYNLIFTGTASSVLALGASDKLMDSKVTNTSTTAGRSGLSNISAKQNLYIKNNELQSQRGVAFSANTGSAQFQFLNNTVHNSDIGVTDAGTGPCSYTNNTFEGIVTTAINITGAKVGNTAISGNTFYGAENKLGTAVSFATGTTNARVLNNIFYGYTTGVTHADTQTVGVDDFNDYSNTTTDVTNWTKGANDVALNPGFTSMTQVTGTNATISAAVLTSSGANFPTFTPGKDFLYLKSGTAGPTFGIYGIVSNTSTTITLDSSPGNSATADHVFQVTTGHNLGVSTTMRAIGTPALFPGGTTTGYTDLGAVQRRERITTGGSH